MLAPTMNIFESRKQYSLNRIDTFKTELAVQPQAISLGECKKICIYTTGSFGRMEGSEFSDLDLFFVVPKQDDQPKKLDKTLMDADLIRLCEKQKYPPFSGDGAYLKVHTIDDLCRKIGDQTEDAENLFTARMLLFLESKCLHNAEVYERAINQCITEYCRDLKGHEHDFLPLFLMNDISRFWKTLCLNYEYARSTITPETKAKHRVKNLKLKFSRLLTCYSMIACLCDGSATLDCDKLSRLVKMTPLERLEDITTKHSLKEIYAALLEEYEWFLTITTGNKYTVERVVTDNFHDVRRRAGRFGDQIYDLLRKISSLSETNMLRYLVV